MIRRLRHRLAVRKHRHYHADATIVGVYQYTHSHPHQEVWHLHGYGAPCQLPECDPFPLHRCHPQPVVPMEDTVKYGNSKFGEEL